MRSLTFILCLVLFSSGCAYRAKIAEVEQVTIDSYSRVLVLHPAEFNRTLRHNVYGTLSLDDLDDDHRKEYQKLRRLHNMKDRYWQFFNENMGDHVEKSLRTTLVEAGVEVVGDSVMTRTDSGWKYLARESLDKVDYIIVPHSMRIDPEGHWFAIYPFGIILFLPTLGIFPIDCTHYPTSLSFSVYDVHDLTAELDLSTYSVEARRCESAWTSFPKGYDVKGFKSALENLVDQEVEHLQRIYLF